MEKYQTGKIDGGGWVRRAMVDQKAGIAPAFSQWFMTKGLGVTMNMPNFRNKEARIAGIE